MASQALQVIQNIDYSSDANLIPKDEDFDVFTAGDL